MGPKTKEKSEINEEIPKGEESVEEEIIPDICKFAEDFKKQMNKNLTKLIERTLKENPKEKTSEESEEEEIMLDIGKFAEDFKKQMNEGLIKLIEMTSLRIIEYEKLVEMEKTEKEEGIKNANKRAIKNLMPSLTRFYNVKDTEDEEIISIKKLFDNFCKNEGITIILPSIDENLDENFHHAVKTSETDNEQQDNKIVNVIRIGCRYTSGNVIVPAEVIVSKKKQNMR